MLGNLPHLSRDNFYIETVQVVYCEELCVPKMAITREHIYLLLGDRWELRALKLLL
jgi:hypothetical protein